MVSSRQILGIQFFNGDVEEAVGLMLQRGGLLVAPSGTCFARLRADKIYRRAVIAADLAIADSGLMVVLWRLFRRERVQRISGLKYLKHLLGGLKGEGKRTVLWVLPTKRAEQKFLDWSRGAAFPIMSENWYVAPRYGVEVAGIAERLRDPSCRRSSDQASGCLATRLQGGAIRGRVCAFLATRAEHPNTQAWGRRKDVKVFGCSDDCASRCGCEG